MEQETNTVGATFEVTKDNAEQFRWTLRHTNGRIIADGGEGYTTKEKCIQGINSVKTNVAAATIKDMTTTSTN